MESNAERPRKRQKIALACDTCRSRKVKCDGAQPICGLCAKRKDKGGGCRYRSDRDSRLRYLDQADPTLSPLVSNRFITSAVTSFSKKPLLSQHHASISSPRSPARESTQSPRDAIRYHHPERLSSRDMSRAAASANIPNDATTPQQEKSRGIDSMTGVGGDETNSQQYFGSSSAGSFMRQIKLAVDAKIGLPQLTPSEIGASRAPLFLVSSPDNQDENKGESIEYVLPPRKTADSLAAVYWTLVHPLYPFLDEEMFQEAYESIWSGSSTAIDERMLMCTLNVMFALACQLSQSILPEQREMNAKIYFKRAQDLLRLDLWDIGSAELIQCLLLMGQYLQSTNTPHQCWMVIGHAVRIAQGLGFHLAESGFDLKSPWERELARRIWHGCILMDRVLSMTFGRPAMISKSLADAVPLPAMIDNRRQVGIVDTPQDNGPSVTAFFVKSLHLYGIINDILLRLYMDHHGAARENNQSSLFHHAESDDIATVFELDQALMTWGQTLPSHLRLSSIESTQNDVYLRQSVVCRARFLHARMLLFRPILSQFCLPSTSQDTGTAMDESLAERMVLQCSTLCLRTAHDMIDLIYTYLNIEKLTGPLPAWWYTVLYVYTAATVLLAARLRPVIVIGVSAYSIEDSWAHAIEILKSFQRLGQSAQRCVAALEILSAKVSLDVFPAEINQELGNEYSRSSVQAATTVPDVAFDDYQVALDFSGITFDLNDMSWLSSLPGNL